MKTKSRDDLIINIEYVFSKIEERHSLFEKKYFGWLVSFTILSGIALALFISSFFLAWNNFILASAGIMFCLNFASGLLLLNIFDNISQGRKIIYRHRRNFKDYSIKQLRKLEEYDAFKILKKYW
jgi:hypothetical protein